MKCPKCGNEMIIEDSQDEYNMYEFWACPDCDITLDINEIKGFE